MISVKSESVCIIYSIVTDILCQKKITQTHWYECISSSIILVRTWLISLLSSGYFDHRTELSLRPINTMIPSMAPKIDKIQMIKRQCGTSLYMVLIPSIPKEHPVIYGIPEEHHWYSKRTSLYMGFQKNITVYGIQKEHHCLWYSKSYKPFSVSASSAMSKMALLRLFVWVVPETVSFFIRLMSYRGNEWKSQLMLSWIYFGYIYIICNK